MPVIYKILAFDILIFFGRSVFNILLAIKASLFSYKAKIKKKCRVYFTYFYTRQIEK